MDLKTKGMKTLTILLISMISITVNAQNMETINEKVSQLFIACDNRDWNKVEAIFAEQVELDYSSMNGSPALNLSPKQITGNWKTILPGFTYTHHQVGNFITKVSGTEAEVFCYGNASHYLEHKDGNIWTVVGSYNFELKKEDDNWRISKMKFNFKYMDGNTDLPQLAMEKLKANGLEKTNNDLIKSDSAEDNKTNTLAFLKALENMDTDAVVDLFAEDGIHINPYASGIFPEGTKGHKGIRAYWEPVFPNFEKMEFPVEEIYTINEKAMTFVKFKGKIKLKNEAGWYNNDYYATFKFNEEGKITEYVEIFNPIVAAKGFGLLDKIK